MTALSDPRRIIGSLVQLATVESLDLGEATCRVRVGDIVTGDIPWAAPRAGTTRIWAASSVGEQVALFCPEGDFEGGFVIGGLFSDAHAAPGSGTETVIAFADGARILYDPDAHLLDVALPAGARAIIAAPGGMTINGPVTINGAVVVTGKVTASEDVVGAGKSLKDHTHGGVQGGAAFSGPPR